MKNLLEYLVEQDAISVTKVVGPNGAFISAKKADDSTFTLPIGKKSQAGTLKEYNVLFTEDRDTGEEIAIATVNHYEEEETLSLVQAS